MLLCVEAIHSHLLTSSHLHKESAAEAQTLTTTVPTTTIFSQDNLLHACSKIFRSCKKVFMSFSALTSIARGGWMVDRRRGKGGSDGLSQFYRVLPATCPRPLAHYSGQRQVALGANVSSAHEQNWLSRLKSPASDRKGLCQGTFEGPALVTV